jgi:5'-methylthioadenosine phosphorylase
MADVGEELRLETPHGDTSDAITVHDVAGRRVAFLPRHGRGHTIPPHRINSRANIWALHSIGVEQIIAISACGSLRREISPGSVVVCDQFIDRTKNRPATFFDGPDVAHVSSADPYCERLREHGIDACKSAGMRVHRAGTVVVIEGPRYSSRAESRWYAAAGGDIVGMTQYPELILARELGICYSTIAVVTDYDSGLPGDPDGEAVSHEKVLEVFAANIEQVRGAVASMIETLSATRDCGCAESGARVFA